MPVRIYDIAKKLGIESKDVLVKAKALGITAAKVPSSSLDKITAEFLEESLAALARPTAGATTPTDTAETPAVAPPPKEEPAPAPAPLIIIAPPPPEPAPPEIISEPIAGEEPPPSAPAESVAPVAPEHAHAVAEKPAGTPAAIQPVQPPAPPPAPPKAGLGSLVGRVNLDQLGTRRPTRPEDRPAPKVVTPPPRAGAPGSRPGQGPGGRGQDNRGGYGDQRRGGFAPPQGNRQPAEPAKPSEPKFIPLTTGEIIIMKPPVGIRDLAERLKRKPFQLIADLMELAVFKTVNDTIDEVVAQKVCAKHGFRFETEKRERGQGIVHAPKKAKAHDELDTEDKPETLKPRPPVVTIMGHVDHGKTSLLDVIRKANVAAGESGGITQHIGAYTISFPHPERKKEVQQITFLDTPGHAAFSAMRARGANVTDIVVLVVAANDGVMPQTIEALKHAQAAGTEIIVAVNKCDHPNANPMRVRQQLQEHGLTCEEWGGKTIFVDVSALTKIGVDKLLEAILLQAEVMELKANPVRLAKGNVIESGVEPGGPTATVLVRKGTLRPGNIVLCGEFYGKVRALITEEGTRLKEAGPSTAVKLLGLNGVPFAGADFAVVESDKAARDIAEQRAFERKGEENADDTNRPDRVTLETLFQVLDGEQKKVLHIVIKGDTQGSVEAIVEELKKIDSTKVTIDITFHGVGTITENDVNLAAASKGVVLGFHTRIDTGVADKSKHLAVQIKLYSIIYELIDEVKLGMAGLLDPILRDVIVGSAEVRKLFPLSKGGNVAGCVVMAGRVLKGKVRVMRRKSRIYEGNTLSLRRFQDEVTEVRAGMECGIRIDGFNDFLAGDLIESFSTERIAQQL